MQTLAAPEHLRRNRIHGSRQADGENAVAVAKGHNAYRPEAIGEVERGGEERVVLEGVAPNHPQRRGVVDVGEAAAFAEGALAYRHHALAEGDALEAVAVVEGPLADGAHAARNQHLCYQM